MIYKEYLQLINFGTTRLKIPYSGIWCSYVKSWTTLLEILKYISSSSIFIDFKKGGCYKLDHTYINVCFSTITPSIVEPCLFERVHYSGGYHCHHIKIWWEDHIYIELILQIWLFNYTLPLISLSINFATILKVLVIFKNIQLRASISTKMRAFHAQQNPKPNFN